MGTGTISLELPTDIVYVAGVVNGVNTVFIQDETDQVKWRAIVDVAEDNLYHIYLEMYDEAGNKSTYEDTIEYILPVFVYDRTQADVDRVLELMRKGWNNLSEEEQAEWLGGRMKGALNLSDLKRIENDCYIIAQLLKIDITTRKDDLPQYPNTTYFAAVLANVETLRSAGYKYVETPQVPVQPINSYQKLNDIERILHDVYEVFNTNYAYYAGGEIYAGDTIGLLL